MFGSVDFDFFLREDDYRTALPTGVVHGMVMGFPAPRNAPKHPSAGKPTSK